MKTTNISIQIFIVLFFLLLSGCSEDFLDKSPYAEYTDEVFFKTQDDLDAALIGAYKSITVNDWKRSPEYGWWAFGDIGSDNADKGGIDGNDPDLLDVAFSRQKSSNPRTSDVWRDIYIVIAKANLVIDHSTDVTGNQEVIDRIVNEAKFIRALMYYNLVTYWGGVPLFTSYAYVNEAIRAKSPPEEVWAQIEQDLLDATHLPKKSEYGTDQVGRATSGAAWGMLGKAYIFQKKYNEAADALKHVIDSKEYELVDDFGFMFRTEGSNCNESIFETQHMSNTDAFMGSLNVIAQQPADNGTSDGWAYIAPTQDLVDEFEEGDPRIIYTVLFKGDTMPTPSGEPWIVQNTFTFSGYQSRKAFFPLDERIGNYWDYGKNVIYLRYAEVLLLYAEALNESGHSAEALQYINMVRERARNTPTEDPERIGCIWDLSYTGNLLPDITTTDQNELRNAIYHEQRIELAEEGHRREYLLRTGRFLERMNTAKGTNLTSNKWLLFPIPEDDITKSEGVLIQNPDY